MRTTAFIIAAACAGLTSFGGTATAQDRFDKKFAGMEFGEAWNKHARVAGAPLVHVRGVSATGAVDYVAQADTADLAEAAAEAKAKAARLGLLEEASVAVLYPAMPGSARNANPVAPCGTGGSALRCLPAPVPKVAEDDNHGLTPCTDKNFCDWIYFTTFADQGMTSSVVPPAFKRKFRSYESVFAIRNRSGANVAWRALRSMLWGDTAAGIGDGVDIWDNGLEAPYIGEYYCDTNGDYCKVFAYERYGYGEWKVAEVPVLGLGGAANASKNIYSKYCVEYRETEPGYYDDHVTYSTSTHAEHSASGNIEYVDHWVIKGQCI